jgi:hypothetical protein
MTAVNDHKQAQEHLQQTIDNYFAHKYQREVAARDRQFEKLLDWARKVSAKTGVPLENL